MTITNPQGNPPSLTSDQAALVADIFSALADPTRARIVFALTHGEFSVNMLASMADVSPSAVSHHLARLRSSRLVRPRRAANQVFYTIDDAHVSRLFYEAIHHLDHVRQNLPGPEAVFPLDTTVPATDL
jgi:DNA-binding transcriptional ArsR family regulator